MREDFLKEDANCVKLIQLCEQKYPLDSKANESFLEIEDLFNQMNFVRSSLIKCIPNLEQYFSKMAFWAAKDSGKPQFFDKNALLISHQVANMNFEDIKLMKFMLLQSLSINLFTLQFYENLFYHFEIAFEENLHKQLQLNQKMNKNLIDNSNKPADFKDEKSALNSLIIYSTNYIFYPFEMIYLILEIKKFSEADRNLEFILYINKLILKLNIDVLEHVNKVLNESEEHKNDLCEKDKKNLLVMKQGLKSRLVIEYHENKIWYINQVIDSCEDKMIKALFEQMKKKFNNLMLD